MHLIIVMEALAKILCPSGIRFPFVILCYDHALRFFLLFGDSNNMCHNSSWTLTSHVFFARGVWEFD